MDRLCERPGCSEPASVAYGMRPEDLIFWLDTLVVGSGVNESGALCRRHADSMVVPRNWTLDDQRDPDLHLFRPPAADGRPARRSRRGRHGSTDAEQLALGVDRDVDGDAAAGTSSTAATRADEQPGTTEPGEASVQPGEPGEPVEPWTPTFDSSDDLDGLLAARSPLLARAFRGDDRPAR